MAKREHLRILKEGTAEWNIWRERNPLVIPNLSKARLKKKNLYELHPVPNSKHVTGVVQEIDLSEVNFNNADLQGATLFGAELVSAKLRGANLRKAILLAANFTHADLTGADFTGAYIGRGIFANNDLSSVIGLESVIHEGPSFISTETLYKSGGRIPQQFLQGCGVPDELITYLPSLLGAQQAVQFYSCFISYSTKDEDFARRLHSRMRDEHLRVWFAPEDVKGGEKLYEQIDRAIQLHDRLLLVLSESSLRSKWVVTEIRRARKVELRENRRKLFPIRLVDFDALQAWECFDADTGEDLASEVRQYYIPDFSNWKDHDAFERAFDRLLRDLRAEEKKA